mmetsp:Transcript_85198/g.275871  ORF Transcript_85198/g.275871 Transcript_85198/m.275871 type:complete len:315 (-) Transcript_85198:292-1236(-)
MRRAAMTCTLTLPRTIPAGVEKCKGVLRATTCIGCGTVTTVCVTCGELAAAAAATATCATAGRVEMVTPPVGTGEVTTLAPAEPGEAMTLAPVRGGEVTTLVPALEGTGEPGVARTRVVVPMCLIVPLALGIATPADVHVGIAGMDARAFVRRPSVGSSEEVGEVGEVGMETEVGGNAVMLLMRHVPLAFCRSTGAPAAAAMGSLTTTAERAARSSSCSDAALARSLATSASRWRFCAAVLSSPWRDVCSSSCTLADEPSPAWRSSRSSLRARSRSSRASCTLSFVVQTSRSAASHRAVAACSRNSMSRTLSTA